ncbi:MAG: hypothetical protein OXC27_12805, partial [Caldilineaceae bacterium]|nr:hypothetical protein [Caldilineaceae bacterium]
PDDVDPRKISTLFIQEMARRGIHTYMSFKATLAHTDEDIQLTGAAAAEALGLFGPDWNRAISTTCLPLI